MKLMFKLMLAILVLAFVLPFTPLMPGGKPLMSLSEIRMPEFSIPDMPSFGAKEPVLRRSGKVQTFYRWRDAQGNIQYSDKPPQGNVNGLSSLDINPNTNLVPAVKAPPEPKTAQLKEKKGKTDSTAPSSFYSTNAIQKLFEDANKIKEQALERNKALQ